MLCAYRLKSLFSPTRIRHRRSGTRRADAMSRSTVVAAELLEYRLLLTSITQITSFSGSFLLSDASVSDGKIAYMADPPGAAVANVFVHDLGTGVTTNVTGFFTGSPSITFANPSI